MVDPEAESLDGVVRLSTYHLWRSKNGLSLWSTMEHQAFFHGDSFMIALSAHRRIIDPVFTTRSIKKLSLILNKDDPGAGQKFHSC